MPSVRPFALVNGHQPGGVVADEIKNVAGGAKNPLKWAISGRAPVDKSKSTARAGTCIGCPLNGHGELTEWFTIPAAQFLKKVIESRHKLEMETFYDAALGVCEPCHCVLVLKVHEPIDLVQKGLKPRQKAKLWENCWILRELSQPPEEK